MAGSGSKLGAVEEVEEGLVESVLIGPDDGPSARHEDDVAARPQEGLEVFRKAFEKGIDFEGGELETRAVPLRARELENVLDQGAQAPGLAVDDLEGSRPLLVATNAVEAKGLGEHPDLGQRSALPALSRR